MINNQRNVVMKVGAADKAFIWVELNISIMTVLLHHKAMSTCSLTSVTPSQPQPAFKILNIQTAKMS